MHDKSTKTNTMPIGPISPYNRCTNKKCNNNNTQNKLQKTKDVDFFLLQSESTFLPRSYICMTEKKNNISINKKWWKNKT